MTAESSLQMLKSAKASSRSDCLKAQTLLAAPFSFDMESDELDKEMVKELVLREVKHYNAKHEALHLRN